MKNLNWKQLVGNLSKKFWKGGGKDDSDVTCIFYAVIFDFIWSRCLLFAYSNKID
jgi:hypothetical protein